MNIVDKLKSEPRIYIALAIFVSFFFSWLNVGGKTSVMGYSSSSSAAYNVFALTEEYVVTYVLIVIPIIMIVFTFIEPLEPYNKIVYLVLSIICIIIMIRVTSVSDVSAGGSSVSVAFKASRGLGFWIALIANGAIIVYTLIRDFNFNSKENIREELWKLNTENIKSKARNLSNKAEDVAVIECSKCGNKVIKGKKFCGKCGNPMPQVSSSPKKASSGAVKCPKCGKELYKGALFCIECGTKVVKPVQNKICPSCGVKLPPDAKFCAKCGNKIGE